MDIRGRKMTENKLHFAHYKSNKSIFIKNV